MTLSPSPSPQPEPPSGGEPIRTGVAPVSQGQGGVADIDRELTLEDGLASLGRAFAAVCARAERR